MDEKLIAAALKAADNAYAPYSKFKVGAAVLLEDGTIVTGNNQENSSYPVGMCAERIALNYAKALYPNLEVEKIAIASPSSKEMVAPCGACRQVMSEIVLRQKRDFQVIMVRDKERITKSVDQLLPLAFIL